MANAQPQTIQWQGASGVKYTYWIYNLPPNFTAAPGNYIFAKKDRSGAWVPVYIGETRDLSERFDAHHKAASISAQGATHIHVHASNASEAARRQEEADLVAWYHPPCNG